MNTYSTLKTKLGANPLENRRNSNFSRCPIVIPALPFCHVTLTAAKTKTYDSVVLGEHIKKARIERRLTQSNTVAFLSVSVETLHNWETPTVKHWPAIMDFLGYYPYQKARSLGDRLRLHRMHRGLKLEQFAEMIGVDAGSVSSWEKGERRRDKRSRAVIERLLTGIDFVAEQ